MAPIRSSLVFVGGVFVLLSVQHCSSSPTDPSSSGAKAPSSRVIGAAGGSVASSDGVLSVSIPAGAVSGDVMVTVSPLNSPPAGAVGVVYDIGPTGTVFNAPVTMTFHYALASLGSASPSSLRAATYGSNAWQILAGGSVDTTAQTVSGTTMHLSPYGEIVESSGEVCATVGQTGDCAGGSVMSGGSGTSTGGSSGPATTASPATGTCPTAPTCATATNTCSGYPGSTMTGCTDGANGYAASCCFAPAAPICIAVSGSATCGGTANGGAVSCPQQTCAGAVNPCAQFPGATFSNCTDAGSGWAGSCCFAPGTPVCVTESGGVGCSSGGAATGTSGNGTSSGSSGFQCPAPPTCAESQACRTIAGATKQSCTDTSAGYTATCCLPLGVLPGASGGGSSGSAGGSLSGNPEGDGGPSSGGGPTTGPGGADAALPPDPGGPTGPDKGDAASLPPDPGQPDGGAAFQPDASACHYDVLPLSGGTCGVKGNCPATADSYQMICTVGDSGPAACTCQQNGATTGSTNEDCGAISTASIIDCKYPAP